MSDFIAERSRRMYAACSGVNPEPRFPLLIESKLSYADFCMLKDHVNIYLYESLHQAIPDCLYHLNGSSALCSDTLQRYEYEIAKLPNITPNGLLLPKKDSWLSFNMLYKAVARIVKGFGLQDVAGIHHPINVRIVNGTPNPAIDSRPRASVKLHSDIWAGELTNHIMMYFPIMGDMNANGVDLYEPGDDFYPSYVRPLKDFNEGSHLLKSATKYDIVMEPGNVYFLDSFLLHQTMKRAPGLRLVINFAFLTNSMLSSDLPVETERRKEYIDPARWYDYGSRHITVTEDELREFDNQSGEVRNAYAQTFDTVSVYDLPNNT